MTPYFLSGESFYANALRAYTDRFGFDGDPLDVALRKLLMDVGLPRETQQIDRIMEAFANRYLASHRSLFVSDGMSSMCRDAYFCNSHRHKIIPIFLPSV